MDRPTVDQYPTCIEALASLCKDPDKEASDELNNLAAIADTQFGKPLPDLMDILTKAFHHDWLRIESDHTIQEVCASLLLYMILEDDEAASIAKKSFDTTKLTFEELVSVSISAIHRVNEESILIIDDDMKIVIDTKTKDVTPKKQNESFISKSEPMEFEVLEDLTDEIKPAEDDDTVAPFRVLFKTFMDSSAEYKMEKIELQENELKALAKGIKGAKVETLSLTGDIKKNLVITQQFLQLKETEFDIEAVLHHKKLPKEGIIVFQNENKLVFIFLSNNHEILDYNKTYKSQTFINYYRYLIDFSRNLGITLPEDLIWNEDTSNPFSEQCMPSFSYQEKENEALKKFEIKQIPNDKKDEASQLIREKSQVFKDISRNIVIFDIKEQSESIKKFFSVEQKLLFSDKQSSQKTIPLNYQQLKSIILKDWAKDCYFFKNKYGQVNIDWNLKKIFYQLVPNSNSTKFQDLLQATYYEYMQLNDNLKSRYEDITKNDLEAEYQLADEKIAVLLCPNFAEKDKEMRQKYSDIYQSVGNKGFTEKIGNAVGFYKREQEIRKYKCFDCKLESICELAKKKKYEYINDKKFARQTPQIHHSQQELFEEVIRELNEKNKEVVIKLEKEKKQSKQEIRDTTLQNFFKALDKIVDRVEIKKSSVLTFQFLSTNIIKNESYQVSSWNLTKMNVLAEKKINSSTYSNMTLESVYWLDDTSGVILISASPQSFLYSFTKQGKSIIFNEQFHPTPNAHLSVETHQKLFCLYDNHTKRISTGKINKGKLEEGSIISGLYDREIDGGTITQIKSLVFMPFVNSFYFFNQDNQLFQYKMIDKKLTHCMKKVNKDEAGVVSEKLTPNIPTEFYDSITISSDAKTLLLKAKSSIDLYDTTWTKIEHIPISKVHFKYFKSFSDGINHYLLICENSGFKCFQLQGLSSTKEIISKIEENEEAKSRGNPIVDFVSIGLERFGPQSSFIGCSGKTDLTIILNEIAPFDGVNMYIENLEIPNLSHEIVSQDEFSVETLKKFQIDAYIMRMIIMSRVPLHVATIENFNLTPLRNGKNVTDQILCKVKEGEKGFDFVQAIKNFIEFGVYESLLKDFAGSVRVVSIIGRQSSGKSYVLNQLFGTRFNVAGHRCTDGIWISTSYVYLQGMWQLFIIFDCEGLFSTRRTEQDEIKLCLGLAAVSDWLILNQDASFSRYLTSLFNSFSKSIGKLKGKSLFRGTLAMLIRDISAKDFKDTYKELNAYMQQVRERKNNFLEDLFQGSMLAQTLHHFENDMFKKEIVKFRNGEVINIKQRWKNGTEFLDTIKLVLCQIFLDDDTDMDIHKMTMLCEKYSSEAEQLFLGSHLENLEAQFIYKREVKFDEKIKYDIEFNHGDIMLDFTRSSDENPASKYIDIFFEKTEEYSEEKHNVLTIQVHEYLKDVLNQRKEIALQYLTSNILTDVEYQTMIDSYLLKLKSQFDNAIEKCLYCENLCRQCKRHCTLKQLHKGDCNCETDHICKRICEMKPSCKEKGYLCCLKYGHSDSHKCNEGSHACGQPCQFSELGCKYTCLLNTGHDESVSHNCTNKHPCTHKCDDDECTRTCQFSLEMPHDIHDCGETKCIHKCFLCEKHCAFPNHFHHQLIEDEESEKLKLGGIEVGYHICDQQHQCEHECTQEGLCGVDYKVDEAKEWKSELGSFTFPYFEPIKLTKKCSCQIPKSMLKHEELHNCGVGAHRCNTQCPECKSFCNKNIGHEGPHSSNAHRNKEHNKFCAEEAEAVISIKAESKIRKYKVGDKAEPENCTAACERKSRAHFHLKECPGGDMCAAKTIPGVKHSTKKYYPFLDKVFDEWLCEPYWDYYNWEMPVADSKKEEMKLCNFYCGHLSHKDEYSFCTQRAWHDGKHVFDCKHKEGNFDVLDIAFCCDTTGSMGSYIRSAIDTCKTMIKKFQVGKRDIKIAFCGYRDHHAGEEYITKCNGFQEPEQAIKFIDTFSANGGGDGPEAVLDGLDDVCKLPWRKDSAKYVFHIADAPPHGRQYVSGGDTYPDGCPCGKTIETISTKLKAQNIKYKLLKIGTYPEKMAEIFKKKIEDFEECELKSASQMSFEIVDEILIRDLKNQEIDYHE